MNRGESHKGAPFGVGDQNDDTRNVNLLNKIQSHDSLYGSSYVNVKSAHLQMTEARKGYQLGSLESLMGPVGNPS